MKLPLSFLSRASFLAALSSVVSFPSASSLRADAVFAWNEAMLQAAEAREQPLHLEARAFALAHLAMAEAVEGIDTGDADFDRPARRAAAATAAHHTLLVLLPASHALFDGLLERQLAALPSGPSRLRGEAAGAVAAERALAARSDDGWEETETAVAAATELRAAAGRARSGDGPPSPWQRLRPFALTSMEQFSVAEVRNVRASGDVTVDYSLTKSRFFDGVDVVAAQQARVGFWAQSPVAAWNRIARQACAGGSVDLREQARLFSALNRALADAVVAARHARHVVGSWRSVTTAVWHAVGGHAPLATDQLAVIDGGLSIEPVRLDYGQTMIPPVGDYPSIHATAAGAAQAVLDAHFGRRVAGFALPIPSDPRTFPSFLAAAREHAFAASLDGVHTRESCVAGHRFGLEIGRHVGRRAALVQR